MKNIAAETGNKVLQQHCSTCGECGERVARQQAGQGRGAGSSNEAVSGNLLTAEANVLPHRTWRSSAWPAVTHRSALQVLSFQPQPAEQERRKDPRIPNSARPGKLTLTAYT